MKSFDIEHLDGDAWESAIANVARVINYNGDPKAEDSWIFLRDVARKLNAQFDAYGELLPIARAGIRLFNRDTEAIAESAKTPKRVRYKGQIYEAVDET